VCTRVQCKEFKARAITSDPADGKIAIFKGPKDSAATSTTDAHKNYAKNTSKRDACQSGITASALLSGRALQLQKEQGFTEICIKELALGKKVKAASRKKWNEFQIRLESIAAEYNTRPKLEYQRAIVLMQTYDCFRKKNALMNFFLNFFL